MTYRGDELEESGMIPEAKLSLEELIKRESHQVQKVKWFSKDNDQLATTYDPVSNIRGNLEFNAYQLVEYSPNYELMHFWRELEKRFFIFIGSLIVFFALGCIFNFLTPLMRFMAHTFIAPLKPILVDSAGNASVTVALDTLGTVSFYGFCAIGLVIAYLVLSSYARATQLGLTSSGIYILRRVLDPMHEEYVKIKYVPWSSIKDVVVERPKLKKSVKDFVIKLEDESKDPVRIRYGDIFKPEQRNYFVMNLSQHATTFDKNDLALLKPLDDNVSYTDLWLKELSAPPKRDKLKPLSPGTILNGGKYRVISKIGIGGQGTVYYAHSSAAKSVDQEIVLKEFVLPIFPDPRVRRQSAERFQEEANLLSKLKHDQIVDFVEIFIEDHRLYMVMENVEGETLEDLVGSNGAQPSAYVKELMLSMAGILAFLHDQKPPVIHRDFTPDNLILETSGQIKLIDFSVAMEIQNDITGSVVGKMNYIAPEQFQGKPTIQSDIYSLGATAHYLLTKELPEPITMANPLRINDKVDESLNTIVKKCTHLDVKYRYQSVEQLIKDLENCEI